MNPGSRWCSVIRLSFPLIRHQPGEPYGSRQKQDEHNYLRTAHVRSPKFHPAVMSALLPLLYRDREVTSKELRFLDPDAFREHRLDLCPDFLPLRQLSA